MKHAARPGLAAVTATLLLLTACGEDDSDVRAADPGAGPETVEVDLPADAPGSRVPEECVAPFPTAWGEPDLASLDLVPAGWPEPPVDDAVLCTTSRTVDESVQSVGYATSLDGAAVLDRYEEVLAGATVSRDESPGGGHEVLNGQFDDVMFTIDTRDGGFSVTFTH